LVRVSVDTSKSLGSFDYGIYGHFIEPLGHCVYGGIWPDRHQQVERHRGMRTDVLRLVRELHIPNMRLAGGCYSQEYCWEDGIGPIERRAAGWFVDWVWNKPDPNTVGTDEYLAFAEEGGFTPILNVNLRRPTEEAARWVRYCNEPPDGEMGSLRAQYGHPEPYRVRIWNVGNENWEWDPEKYAEVYDRFAQAMLDADPDLELIAVGDHPDHPGWLPRILRAIRCPVHYVEAHAYTGVAPKPGSWDAYYELVGGWMKFVDHAAKIAREVAESGREGVRPTLGEWSNWWNYRAGHHQNLNMGEGLQAAATFMGLQSVRPALAMANWAQLVNNVGVIQADRTRSYGTPVYWVYWMLSHLCGSELLECSVDGGSGPPYLIVRAYRDAEGRLAAALLNLRHDDEHRVELDLGGTLGQASVYRISSETWTDVNTYETPHSIAPREEALMGDSAELVLPPLSLTVVTEKRVAVPLTEAT
jgi:alpha-N-arabinofuranosidase